MRYGGSNSRQGDFYYGVKQRHSLVIGQTHGVPETGWEKAARIKVCWRTIAWKDSVSANGGVEPQDQAIHGNENHTGIFEDLWLW